MRLGVYSDLLYCSDGQTLSTHQAFVTFVTSLPPRVEEVVLFGRLDPHPARSHYPLPDDKVRFVPLPHYPRITSLLGQARALRRTRRIFVQELARLDAVWIFGPHPLAVVLALAARRHGTPLFLGVRQDYPAYIAARLPSKRWFWAVGVAHALERTFRMLARAAPAVTVGDELARLYAAGDAPVLSTGFSLVRSSDLVELDTALARDWCADVLRILSVGRLDPEKNPLLLIDVVRRLREHDPRWHMTIVGSGPLDRALERRVAELGLAHAVTMLGYVPLGPRLWDLYRSHQVFLHVSRTEGFPQVLFEAQAAGTPIVATAVGGVAASIARSGGALLIPPNDAEAAVAAICRIAGDADLRRRLVAEGLQTARAETMEAQLDRIIGMFVDWSKSGGRDRATA
jgi:glycosyltransferase involved in cell wall biosynthesis